MHIHFNTLDFLFLLSVTNISLPQRLPPTHHLLGVFLHLVYFVYKSASRLVLKTKWTEWKWFIRVKWWWLSLGGFRQKMQLTRWWCCLLSTFQAPSLLSPLYPQPIQHSPGIWILSTLHTYRLIFASDFMAHPIRNSL